MIVSQLKIPGQNSSIFLPKSPKPYSPFYALYGFHPNVFIIDGLSTASPSSNNFIARLLLLKPQLDANLNTVVSRFKKNADFLREATP